MIDVDQRRSAQGRLGSAGSVPEDDMMQAQRLRAPRKTDSLVGARSALRVLRRSFVAHFQPCWRWCVSGVRSGGGPLLALARQRSSLMKFRSSVTAELAIACERSSLVVSAVFACRVSGVRFSL